MTEQASAVRLDKWLWAARFFKTRNLAKAAVEGGKVHCDGQRSKPSRLLKGGEMLEILRGRERFEVRVLALSERRGPAREAAGLYAETDQSRQRREQEQALRRLEYQSRPVPAQRPGKHQRRRLQALRGKR